MTVYFSDQVPALDSNSIFLAGPTRRDSYYKKSWRKDAVRILREDLNFDGIVYVPELYEERNFREEEVEKQTRWEWACLDAAGIVAFWIPRTLPDMPAFTTNVEFGIYTEKKPSQVVLGCPPDAEKMRYLKLRYSEIGNGQCCATLEETMKESVRRLAARSNDENRGDKR